MTFSLQHSKEDESETGYFDNEAYESRELFTDYGSHAMLSRKCKVRRGLF